MQCRKWKFLRKTTEYFISTWLLFSFNWHYEKKVLVEKELLTLQEHLRSSPSRAPSIIPIKSTFHHPLQEHLPSSPSRAPSIIPFKSTFHHPLQEHLRSSPSRAPSIIPFKSTFDHPLQEHLRSSPVLVWFTLLDI